MKKIILMSLLSLIAQVSQAQNDDFGEGSGGPYGSVLYDFVEINDGQFLFATRFGLFKGGLTGDIQPVESEQLTRIHYTRIYKDINGTIWLGANGNSGGSGEHLFYSEDDGLTWSPIDFTYPTMSITDIMEDQNQNLYVSSIYNSGIMMKASGGSEWESITTDIPNKNILDVYVTTSGLLLAGTQNGAYYTEDGGTTWTKAVIDIPNFQYVYNFAELADTVYAATLQGIFKSSDGKTFELTSFNGASQFVTVIDNELYAGGNDRFYKAGESFSSFENLGSKVDAERLKSYNSKFYAFTDALYLYDETTSDWKKQWFDIEYMTDLEILDSGAMVVKSRHDLVYTEGWGEPWRIIFSSESNRTLDQAQDVVASINSTTLFTISKVGQKSTLFKTTDLENWSSLELPDNKIPLELDTDNEKNLYLLTNSGLLRSDNLGNSWTQVISYTIEDQIRRFEIYDNHIFLFSTEGKLLYSMDKGNTTEEWSHGEGLFNDVTRLSDGTWVFAAGVTYTTIDGTEFIESREGMLRTSVNSIINVSDTLYAAYGAGNLGNGVYVSLDSAMTWSRSFTRGLESGAGHNDIDQNKVDGHIYTLNPNTGLYRTIKSSDVATSVETDLQLPSRVSLGHNYPNPFNPTTTIPFKLRESGEVRLELFNILGQRIQILLNQTMNAGTHHYNLNGANLSSGTYLYSLTFNGEKHTKSFVLIK